jgi:hypothetical protein
MLFCVGYFYVGLSSLLADWLRQTGGAAEEAADLHAPVTRVQTLPESADLPGARK